MFEIKRNTTKLSYIRELAVIVNRQLEQMKVTTLNKFSHCCRQRENVDTLTTLKWQNSTKATHSL